MGISSDRTWSEEFEGPAGQPPDPSTWISELGAGGWGCGQAQHYTSAPANAQLTGDGRLALTARREPDGRITSARLITKGRVSARHGRIEAQMLVPAEPGSWSAFWMLGDDIDDVGWPACGEIDVMEHVAIDPARVHGTLHGPGYSGLDGGIGRATTPGAPSPTTSTATPCSGRPPRSSGCSMITPIHRMTPADVPGPWPFDHDFHLLLNLAVGGAWPGNADVEPTLPATLLVDWVRIATWG